MSVGVDAVVSVLGAPALTTQKAFIDAAAEAGVKRFLPSEFGCDTQAPYLYILPVFAFPSDGQCRRIDLPSQTRYCELPQRIG